MRLAFAITTYKDSAEQTIAELKQHYPTAHILTFDDAADRLKLPRYAGCWTERYLNAFLETDAGICIKLDPDTAVLRPVRVFPAGDVFGQSIDGIVCGGAIGFTREAAQLIVTSGFLRDEKYTDMKYSYQRWGARWLRPGEEANEESVSYQDGIVQDIVHRLGLKTVSWKEVCMRVWHPQTVMPMNDDYAFVHPRS